MSRSGIVNVRMVITEEKMLSNIDKVQKLINPKSKKQIVQLDDDTYFKDLIESIKTYLVEFATNQFEENTKQIEELIRQREANIALAGDLKEILEIVENKEDGWKQELKESSDNFPEDIVEALNIIGKARTTTSQNYQDAMKLVNARIVNLESNLHIEIDMERIEDRSKALSYIGIEIADALKLIPTPQEDVMEAQEVVEEPVVENNKYIEETRFEVKPSLWQRIKESKVGRAIRYIFKVRVVLEVPALPEAREEGR